MVETGVKANGMVEITSKWIVQKKSLLRGRMPLTVNTYSVKEVIYGRDEDVIIS
jgi:hypothetical protein